MPSAAVASSVQAGGARGGYQRFANRDREWGNRATHNGADDPHGTMSMPALRVTRPLLDGGGLSAGRGRSPPPAPAEAKYSPLRRSRDRSPRAGPDAREFSKLSDRHAGTKLSRLPQDEQDASDNSTATTPSHGDRKKSDLRSALLYCGSHFVLIPDGKHKYILDAWDILIVSTLLFTISYEPYTAALVDVEWIGYTVINRIFDVLFSCDIVIQFAVAFAYSSESASRELWERDPVKIAKRFAGLPCSDGGCGRFWADILSILPFWAELLLKFAEDSIALRFMRFLRMGRVRHLSRMPKLVNRLHEKLGMPFYLVEIFKCMMITSIALHWMACIWITAEGRITPDMRAIFNWRTTQPSWLTALIAAKGDSCEPDVTRDAACVYFIALYWATMTLTSVGYGDIIPQNKCEYVACSVCMLFCGYIWAYIVATVVSLIMSMNPHEKDFRQRADDIGELMQQRELPRDLQVHLRTYMHFAKNSKRQLAQQDLLEHNGSHGLQREIAKHSGVMHDVVRGIYWAADLEQDALLNIVKALKPSCFGPQEVILVHQAIILVRRGLAAVKGKVMSRGEVWGHEDVLLETDHLIDRSCPRTLSYVDIMKIGKRRLNDVCNGFPIAGQRLRRAQIRTAAFRSFVFEAKRLKEQAKQMKEGGPPSLTASGVLDMGAIAFAAQQAAQAAQAERAQQAEQVHTDLTQLSIRIQELQHGQARAAAALSERVDAVQASLDGQTAAVSSQVATLDARLGGIEVLLRQLQPTSEVSQKTSSWIGSGGRRPSVSSRSPG